MLDSLISGGLVVDGTGSAPYRADLGVLDGRVVSIDGAAEARRVVDADGLVVAPGFIDIHTHYDAQVFWDRTLSPSPLHGVTTVVSGNCGFTLAPMDEADADYMMRMLARVEGMPLESLQQGVPWGTWSTIAEYLDVLDGTLTPNVAFMVGHSAIRRAVMHDAAVGEVASDAQVDAMRQLLAGGLRAGAIGLSSTWSPTHNDHRGDPVPSRAASVDELLALCAEVGRHPGTSLEFIPDVGKFTDERMDLMAAMSATADRPLNWNLLAVYSRNAEFVEHQLSASDRAERQGGRVLALTLPDSARFRLNFRSGFLLDLLPGWEALMALPDDVKLAQLADPDQRSEWNRLAQSESGVNRSWGHWSNYRVLETFSVATAGCAGRMVGEIAAERGETPWDTLADIVLHDRLRTVIAKDDPGVDDATWRLRVEKWRDPRTIVGGSDSGAHLDMIDSFSFATTLLGRAMRELQLLPVEEAVHYLTGAPAALYGFVDRGVIREGAHADLVLFDPESIGPGPVETRYDLPGGAARLTGGALGIDRVMVAGTDVVVAGEFVGTTPGRVLRSGVDTTTVTAR